jgi:hypothetical protein
MNRVRAGYPSQLNDLAILRRNLRIRCVFWTREVTVAFTTPRIVCKYSLTTFLLLLVSVDLAAGERFERPYPDSKSRVLPLDDPASWCQRDCFHAPYAQHRRIIDVVAKPPAISARTIRQVAMISATIAIEFRCEFDCKTFELNYLCAHTLVAARRIELPSQP